MSEEYTIREKPNHDIDTESKMGRLDLINTAYTASTAIEALSNAEKVLDEVATLSIYADNNSIFNNLVAGGINLLNAARLLANLSHAVCKVRFVEEKPSTYDVDPMVFDNAIEDNVELAEIACYIADQVGDTEITSHMRASIERQKAKRADKSEAEIREEEEAMRVVKGIIDQLARMSRGGDKRN